MGRPFEVFVRLAFFAGIALAAICAFGDDARSETRVALVIGNANYIHAQTLANPLHDADTVAAALTRAGFSVVERKDLNFDEMRSAILDFSAKTEIADVAVIYYAGHGIQADGVNYLIPVDAALASPAGLRLEAVPADTVLGAVALARHLRLLILDACRDNPFKSLLAARGMRGIENRGLAPMVPEDTNDTVIAYSAKDNTVALDGSGHNSPYAAALARHINEPGVELDKVLREVRNDVLAETNNKQEPFVYGSRGEDFYFVQGSVAGGNARANIEQNADTHADERALWQSVSDSNDPSVLKAYLDQYPNGIFAGAAKAKIASLEKSSSGAIDTNHPTGSFDGVWQIKAVSAEFGGGDNIWTAKITSNGDSVSMSGTCLSGPVKNVRIAGEHITFDCTGSLVGYTFEGTLVSPTRIEGRWRNVMFANTWSADRQ